MVIDIRTGIILAALYIAALFGGTAWMNSYELHLQAEEQAKAAQTQADRE